MLREFGQDIWLSDGPVLSSLGFRYPTRMAIIRLPDGELLVWSPIALNDERRAAVDALGPVRHIVAPNAFHHVHVGKWQAVYPDAIVYAPPKLRAKRPDLRFDRDLDQETPPPGWPDGIDYVVVRGNALIDEVVFFHRPSRTVLFTDLLQQFDPGWFSGWRALVAKLDRMTGTEASMPQKFRLAFTAREKARKSLQAILTWPADKIVIAHGRPVEADGQAFLHRAFAWLDK